MQHSKRKGDYWGFDVVVVTNGCQSWWMNPKPKKEHLRLSGSHVSILAADGISKARWSDPEVPRLKHQSSDIQSLCEPAAEPRHRFFCCDAEKDLKQHSELVSQHLQNALLRSQLARGCPVFRPPEFIGPKVPIFYGKLHRHHEDPNARITHLKLQVSFSRSRNTCSMPLLRIKRPLSQKTWPHFFRLAGMAPP